MINEEYILNKISAGGGGEIYPLLAYFLNICKLKPQMIAPLDV
ncbi:hypothetical protein [Helicobacter sp. WB40]|nr:hypothetical protein [Helicobacter sp. WB40]MDA3967424.1 hypothetical protein [Helicobacter sp. WB40]